MGLSHWFQQPKPVYSIRAASRKTAPSPLELTFWVPLLFCARLCLLDASADVEDPPPNPAAALAEVPPPIPPPPMPPPSTPFPPVMLPVVIAKGSLWPAPDSPLPAEPDMSTSEPRPAPAELTESSPLGLAIGVTPGIMVRPPAEAENSSACRAAGQQGSETVSWFADRQCM